MHITGNRSKARTVRYKYVQVWAGRKELPAALEKEGSLGRQRRIGWDRMGGRLDAHAATREARITTIQPSRYPLPSTSLLVFPSHLVNPAHPEPPRRDEGECGRRVAKRAAKRSAGQGSLNMPADDVSGMLLADDWGSDDRRQPVTTGRDVL